MRHQLLVKILVSVAIQIHVDAASLVVPSKNRCHPRPGHEIQYLQHEPCYGFETDPIPPIVSSLCHQNPSSDCDREIGLLPEFAGFVTATAVVVTVSPFPDHTNRGVRVSVSILSDCSERPFPNSYF